MNDRRRSWVMKALLSLAAPRRPAWGGGVGHRLLPVLLPVLYQIDVGRSSQPAMPAVALLSSLMAASSPTPVVNLPGLPPIDFAMYSGYVDIGPRGKMFYWFVQSQSKTPESDPVLLWTNGGPGCSGLIGFMTENGPFRPTEHGNLTLNPHSWNHLANMVYIEQPVGHCCRASPPMAAAAAPVPPAPAPMGSRVGDIPLHSPTCAGGCRLLCCQRRPQVQRRTGGCGQLGFCQGFLRGLPTVQQESVLYHQVHPPTSNTPPRRPSRASNIPTT
jgi:hypothetical protein